MQLHFGEATRLVELPVSWSLDDYPHFEYHRNASGSLLPGLRPAVPESELTWKLGVLTVGPRALPITW